MAKENNMPTMFDGYINFTIGEVNRGVLFGMTHVDENDIRIGEEVIGVFSVDTIRSLAKEMTSLAESIDI